MPDPNANLKERVRAFWQANPCGVKFADAAPGTRHFYELVEAHRYTKEWHIPVAADFASARGLKVLEIGCGLGTDGAQFAEAGADYTGVDLTEAAVELARKRFELFDLPGKFQTADAENLDFADESFDLVYSHGVLHHTPETGKSHSGNSSSAASGRTRRGHALPSRFLQLSRKHFGAAARGSAFAEVGAGNQAGPSNYRRAARLAARACKATEERKKNLI